MAAFSRQKTPSLRQRRGGSRAAPNFCAQLCLFLLLAGVFCLYVAFMVTVSLNATNSNPGVRKKTPVSVPLPGNSAISLQHEKKQDMSNLIHPHESSSDDADSQPQQQQQSDTILRAYLEPIDQSLWDTKPLPVRRTTASDLTKIEFPPVSCSTFQKDFPVDNYPDADPFLPWIHDVFPTDDGKFIQFVAQNKRRCHTGTTDDETAILKHMQPQVTLFQSVAVKRIMEGEDGMSTRYRLSSHEEADEDGMETRFICRFKPSMQETLSTFNVNYEYASFRKGQKKMFTVEGYDIKDIHTSQLIFQCPVPPNLQEKIKSGETVVNDKASLFVDVIPIRTPPRYGRPGRFFPPRYKEFELSGDGKFDVSTEWGTGHVLPLVENSGRWENIPICKPSLMTYSPYKDEESAVVVVNENEPENKKNHRLVACVWASAGYATRGERYAINDGQRRLQEWINFNLLVGVDHFYVYDNSGAHNNETSLKPITDMFPDQVTRIEWPSQVCNNRPNNVDSPGERSSQYAAESSCRLRFGPYTDWIGGFDIDEYLVPMANYTSLTQLLDKLDAEDTKMFSFPSWRAWPRRAKIEEPVEIKKRGKDFCGNSQSCFELKVPTNTTMLETYNCERQRGPKKEVMPAEKQLYRADYVLLHFVHYSTITKLTMMNKEETEASGETWRSRIGADPKGRFTDELEEATMLHTKAVARQDTGNWKTVCKHNKGFCRIGTPYPPGAFEANLTVDKDGWTYNCWINEKVQDYWVPKLQAVLDSSEKPWLN